MIKNNLDNSVFVEGGVKGVMVFDKELYVVTDDGLKKVLTDLNGKLKLKKVNPNNVNPL